MIYGLGGIIVPFIGIKLIDLVGQRRRPCVKDHAHAATDPSSHCDDRR